MRYIKYAPLKDKEVFCLPSFYDDEMIDFYCIERSYRDGTKEILGKYGYGNYNMNKDEIISSLEDDIQSLREYINKYENALKRIKEIK